MPSMKAMGVGFLGGLAVRGADWAAQKAPLEKTPSDLLRVGSGIGTALILGFLSESAGVGAAGAVGYMTVDVVQSQIAYRKSLATKADVTKTGTQGIKLLSGGGKVPAGMGAFARQVRI